MSQTRSRSRSAARLAAVQALYQQEMEGTPVARLLKEFHDHRLGAVIEDAHYHEAEIDFFDDVVAGTIARHDTQEGVHRAPAGLELGGVCDLGEPVDDATQLQLAALGVNCIRAFRGRGLRIWGARTLSRDEAWQAIPVRRLVTTIARWLALRLADFAFESNDSMTWNRLDREVGGYLDGLHAAGALRGRVAAEAYFIKCDAETNPPEVRDAGMLVAEIGVAPLVPQEFIALRLIQRGGGLSLTDGAP